MQALEIASYLDERISELAKTRLPGHPTLPVGEFQYASFMDTLGETDMNGKIAEEWQVSSDHSRVPGGIKHEHMAKQETSPYNR
jgi:hypothetical protein